jgi:putative Mg2+ transporter-C (MgtC) family protein
MLSHLDFAANLLLAIFLGSLIGVERQWRQRLAGLRTNSLVSSGACLFVLLSQMIPTNGDQSRIASYVVSGVGFLGAGVIMKDGGSIRGLNTAATLWCSAAVGALAGFGLRVEAVMGAVAVICMHLVLRPMAQLVNRQNVEATEEDIRYQVRIVCTDESESHIRSIILQTVSGSALVLRSLQSVDLNGGTQKIEVSAELECSTKQNQQLENLVSRLSLEKGVSAAAWTMRSSGEETV